MKKKKHTDSPVPIYRHILWMLGILFTCPTICLLCAAFMWFDIPSKVDAYSHLSKMKSWEIPLESRFVGFTTNEGVGENTCFLTGVLVIKSRLSKSKIEEFYTNRYSTEYGGDFMGNIYGVLPVVPIGEKSDGLQQFEIRASAIMGDFSCW